MAADRPEPFQVALSALRERLRQGVFRPGERIAAAEVAETLRLSATPVREALSRLAGEGLLEDRRGQGVFVRTLNAVDVADLYRMSEALLLMAQDPERLGARRTEAPAGAEPERLAADPVRDVERLFAVWVFQAGGRSLGAAHRNLQVQLGAVRRAEPFVFEDLRAEAEGLWAAGDDATVRIEALQRFHARRIAVADRLAALLDRSLEGDQV